MRAVAVTEGRGPRPIAEGGRRIVEVDEEEGKGIVLEVEAARDRAGRTVVGEPIADEGRCGVEMGKVVAVRGVRWAEGDAMPNSEKPEDSEEECGVLRSVDGRIELAGGSAEDLGGAVADRAGGAVEIKQSSARPV